MVKHTVYNIFSASDKISAIRCYFGIAQARTVKYWDKTKLKTVSEREKSILLWFKMSIVEIFFLSKS